jgi:predicted MFS family arabinose efflux permease
MTTTRGLRLTPGSWVSFGFIYLFGVSTTASLSKIIPLRGDIMEHLGAGPGQFALLISLLGVLPALVASVAGSVVDRIGPRRTLKLVALVGFGVNLAYLTSDTLGGFMTIRVLEGLIATGAYSAAPALIMATTTTARRGRAMAIWSTYTPVGFSLGLWLTGNFTGEANWRGGYLVHLVAFVALFVVAWILPHMPPGSGRPRTEGLLAAWFKSGPLRLAATFAMLVLIGFGMSSVYPEWYSRQQGVLPGAASSILAGVNLAMIPAGFLAGALLARGWNESRLFNVLLLATMVIAVPLFQPGLPDAARLAVMFVWMLTQGALIALVTAALPRVAGDPRQGAAAAGLLSQLAALVTFITPLIWQPFLQHGAWLGFVAVTVAAAIAIWLLYPRRSDAPG